MFWFVFFFFKQKTAYEIMPSLVGSEMCIRDRDGDGEGDGDVDGDGDGESFGDFEGCLLYTSDAADDLLCVDLGGRRITNTQMRYNPIGTLTWKTSSLCAYESAGSTKVSSPGRRNPSLRPMRSYRGKPSTRYATDKDH